MSAENNKNVIVMRNVSFFFFKLHRLNQKKLMMLLFLGKFMVSVSMHISHAILERNDPFKGEIIIKMIDKGSFKMKQIG